MNRAWISLLLTVLLAGLLLPSFQTFADEQVRSVSAPGLKPDPSGANTGGAADVVGASRGAPTTDDMKNLATNEPLAVKLAALNLPTVEQALVVPQFRVSLISQAGQP